MRTLTEIREILEAEKPYLAHQYGVSELGVFGSYVRGEQRPESDVDVLVAFDGAPHIDLFDLIHLEDHLAEVLGTDVDLAVKESLRKRTGKRILSEVILV